MNPSVDVVVIGGGISGLVTAYRLMTRGASVRLVEATERVGGVLRSDSVSGYQIERGANSFLARERAQELFQEIGIEVIEASNLVKRRFLYLDHGSSGFMHEVPLSPTGALASGILSTGGKFRTIFGAFKNGHSSADDCSVSEFISGLFGKEFAERLMAPVLSGVYAADTAKLSARTALPLLWELSQGKKSLLRTVLGLRKKTPSRPPRIVQFNGGLNGLASAIAQRLGGNISLKTAVQSISDELVVTVENGEAIQTKALVLATQANAAARILGAIAPNIASEISSIPYAPLGLLYVCGKRGDLQADLAGVGFLRQPASGRSVLGALYTSSAFPHCAPEDMVLLTCFVGGMLNPELSDVTDRHLRERAFSELRSILGLGPSFAPIDQYFWKRAIPHYPVGHFRLLEKVSSLESKGIYTASNWLQKPGLSDSVERAEAVAERILGSIR